MEPTETSSDPDDATGATAPIENIPGLLGPVRKVIIFILGISVVIVGIAMIVLPGPATVVIPAGLAILATEFVWAQRWLAYLKRRAIEVAEWGTGTKPEGQCAPAPDDFPVKDD